MAEPLSACRFSRKRRNLRRTLPTPLSSVLFLQALLELLLAAGVERLKVFQANSLVGGEAEGGAEVVDLVELNVLAEVEEEIILFGPGVGIEGGENDLLHAPDGAVGLHVEVDDARGEDGLVKQGSDFGPGHRLLLWLGFGDELGGLALVLFSARGELEGIGGGEAGGGEEPAAERGAGSETAGFLAESE